MSFQYIWELKGLDVLSLQLEGAGAGCPFCAADGVGETGVIYVQLGVGADFLSVPHRVHIFLEMKQGQFICPLSWSVHCNFTGDG